MNKETYNILCTEVQSITDIIYNEWNEFRSDTTLYHEYRTWEIIGDFLRVAGNNDIKTLQYYADCIKKDYKGKGLEV